jgi:hypothetical protein
MARTYGPFGEITVTGVVPKLAPNLSKEFNTGVPQKRETTPVDASGVLTEVMNEDGKRIVYGLSIGGFNSTESIDFELYIDSEMIYQDTVTTGSSGQTASTIWIFGGYVHGASNIVYQNGQQTSFQVDSNITVKVQTTTSTSCSVTIIDDLIK